MKKLIIFIVLVIAGLLFTFFGTEPGKDITTENSYQKATVVKVVDGDTLKVKQGKETFKVRYIGIDTPESVHPDKAKNTAEGKYASDVHKQIIEEAQNTVYLDYDVEETDKYGRHLCYVYIKSGSDYRMVQDILLSEGYARVMTIAPNVSKASHFAKLQREARKNNKGFWGTGFLIKQTH